MKGLGNHKSFKNLDLIVRASGELLKRFKFKKSMNLERNCNLTLKNKRD